MAAVILELFNAYPIRPLSVLIQLARDYLRGHRHRTDRGLMTGTSNIPSASDRFRMWLNFRAVREGTIGQPHHVTPWHRIWALGRQLFGAVVVLEKLSRVELGVAFCSGVLHPTGI